MTKPLFVFWGVIVRLAVIRRLASGKLPEGWLASGLGSLPLLFYKSWVSFPEGGLRAAQGGVQLFRHLFEDALAEFGYIALV